MPQLLDVSLRIFWVRSGGRHCREQRKEQDLYQIQRDALVSHLGICRTRRLESCQYFMPCAGVHGEPLSPSTLIFLHLCYPGRLASFSGNRIYRDVMWLLSPSWVAASCLFAAFDARSRARKFLGSFARVLMRARCTQHIHIASLFRAPTYFSFPQQVSSLHFPALLQSPHDLADRAMRVSLTEERHFFQTFP